MHRAIRLIQALAIAFALSALPIATVSACSCAMTDFGEAVRTAEVAIVATSIRAEQGGSGEIGEVVLTTWQVERSRDAIGTDEIAIRSHPDNGANCGATFAIGERWLVLAYASEGVFETNGCMQNRRLDAGDPETEAVVSELLTELPAPDASEGSVSVPMPLVGIAAVAVLLGMVSLVAFRRRA